MKMISSALAVLLWLVAAPVFAAPPTYIHAVYDVYKSGIKIGTMEEHFTREGERYTLRSVTTPIGILALFKPEKVVVTSTGRVTPNGLRPEKTSHRRDLDNAKNSDAEFDWSTQVLTLTHNGQRQQVPLREGTQDRLSAMYQFLFLPANARSADFPLTNGVKVDDYHYVISSGPVLETPAGTFRTRYLDDQAKPGERHNEIWLANELRSLPCQMLITEADGSTMTQVLGTLEMR
jgi:hypothetical protein